MEGGLLRRRTTRSALELEPAPPRLSRTSPKKIASLPLDKSQATDPDNAYFSEGIQDEILTRLAKNSSQGHLTHIHATFRTCAPNDLPQIARQLT